MLAAHLLLIGLALYALASQPSPSKAAVAAIAAPMKLIAEQFERDTGHKALVSLGATRPVLCPDQDGDRL
jgi:ABC-type molybdate transport system substrate-binding protein